MSLEVNNLIKDCKFPHAVISKLILPKESASNHINSHCRYAVYKVLKRMRVNPAYLIWDYLLKFLQKPQALLPFGSLITTLLEKRGLLAPYLETAPRPDDNIVWPTPIKLGDVKKMKIKFNDSNISEELLSKKTKKKKTEVKEKGKQKVGEASSPKTRKRASTEAEPTTLAVQIPPPLPQPTPPARKKSLAGRIRITSGRAPLVVAQPISSRTRSA